ncbi:MAG: excinuclease ABC subunit UvrA [Saprospiraceae bacterium]|nr:excinuclease ABC subunit UvrA [Saprospiraceae bacterium]
MDHIHIKGARSNNLKNIELKIPKNKLIVVTGLSGSGKSSLIMETLYAEGQRRYVESLSSYARQFLSRMKKPEVDFIKGLCPAIAIEQKVTSGNARSTVGSMTEIYDYLRLLFARIGKTYSPVSGKPVKKHQVSDVVDHISSLKEGTRIQLFFPLHFHFADRTIKKELDLLLQKGFTRIRKGSKLAFIEDVLEQNPQWLNKHTKDLKANEIMVLVDRFVVNDDPENINRIADSVQTSFYEGGGDLMIENPDEKKKRYFNNRFELDGILFLEPSHQLFNYNNPYGACKTCEGYGRIIGVDPYKVIPNQSLSVYEQAVACWKGEKSGKWRTRFIDNAHLFDFPIHRPYKDLTKKERELLWHGNEQINGIYNFFEALEEKSYKIQNRVMMARYRGRTTCHDCSGGRLREEARYVKINDKTIQDLIDLPIDELLLFFTAIKLNKHDLTIAKRILLEIRTRLQTMVDVGLSYLKLDRISSTLSGGETQRINLTRTLSSNLTNSLYILDEPSIGLHPKDTGNLVKVLKNLKSLKNTVIVVEHEEEVIEQADHIIDIGPKAGINGGELMYNGSLKEFKKKKTISLTSEYLTNVKSIPVPAARRKIVNKVWLKGAAQNNLKDINASFPVNALSVVTGVSGSGKTTLVKQILYPALKKHLGEIISQAPGTYKTLGGDLNMISKVEMINQSPIGKSSRSNPATYVKAYDSIRSLFASQQASKIKGFQTKHFSFNVEGGRCENCKGEGETTVEMQFLADVKLTCEDCQGRRFKQEVLEVEYKGKNIFDVLNLSVEEAIEFFKDRRDILNKLKPLDDVGLGYVKLGQSSNSLSGGEAQRVKLAFYLAKENSSDHIFFIFDEPTTGLHFHDINKLMDALNALVEIGHTVVIVEHNMEVIKSADWIIDLGPDGGKGGGELLFEGRPEDLVKVKRSHTGTYLKAKL